ncbi:MAG: DUF1738 domain-containing protein [Calditrichaeota bacterium]|nr:MAG: DUF1738 domain-containing protein [Calditrichota bacterium]
MQRDKIFEKVTNSVIALLEKCEKEGRTLSWCKTWKSEFPQNLVSQKNYRGVNIITASLTCLMNDWERPLFLTFNQVRKLKGKVKKGSHSIPIIFTELKKKEIGEFDEHNDPVTKNYLVYKLFSVFNVSQTEGLEEHIPELVVKEHQPIQEAERIVKNMQNCPEIKIKGQRCFYNPVKDFVGMPKKELFTEVEEFYSALFHELVHSTGHKSRLNRPEVMNQTMFGDEDYSQEELTAELGASYICAVLGIEQKTIENSTAYIQGWLSALRNDKNLLIKSASLSQKAVNYILGD